MVINVFYLQTFTIIYIYLFWSHIEMAIELLIKKNHISVGEKLDTQYTYSQFLSNVSVFRSHIEICLDTCYQNTLQPILTRPY